MIPNPIRKVLSTLANRRVRALLMGGQACVFYGAVEFSRDADLLIFAEAENLDRLNQALDDLAAVNIAVPPFAADYLNRGHGIHFRCQHPEALRLRVDVMARLRGVDPFDDVWSRRTTITGADGAIYELLALPDLVRSKKTQRDKDWPVIRRLLEADFQSRHAQADEKIVGFWLTEMRTPELLAQLATRHPQLAQSAVTIRPLLEAALSGDIGALAKGLATEENHERELDRQYWAPLKAELAELRRQRAIS